MRGQIGAAAVVLALSTALSACGDGVTPSAPDLQEQFIQVVREASPKVVQIQSRVDLGSGVVFDTRGHIVSESDTVRLSPVIQTSAAINPGNSGGALVDLSGRVVGIPTLTAVNPELGGERPAGIGFAIPSTVVTQVATRLIATS